MKRRLSFALSSISLIVSAFLGCSAPEKTTQPLKEQDEQTALGFYLQGSLYDQEADYAKAILEYQKALRVSQNAAVYHVIAKDYASLGDTQQAIEYGQEAVRREPTNRTYHETLAQIYISSMNLDKAIIQYREVVRVDSSYRDGWLSLGRLLQIQK